MYGDFMRKYIKEYRLFIFEEKTIIMCQFSICLNCFLAMIKFILAIYFRDVFFFVAGVFNLFLVTSKIQCYYGVKYPHKRSFKFRNRLISLFLFLAGFQYGIYMTRLLFHGQEVMNYSMFLGVMIAFVSFIEMGFAIKGCFNSYGKGHYYRNIKLINFCSALTAICLTEMAIMSFASDFDSRMIDGMFGVIISIIIELIAIFVLIAPLFSLMDKERNDYEIIDKIKDKEINIQLTNSKFYGNYLYIGKINNNVIEGHIIKLKSPLFKFNIYIKIIGIILSEILIFPYAIGALVFYFKNGKLIKKLDAKMLELGCTKITR